jgi:hypothetical protein
MDDWKTPIEKARALAPPEARVSVRVRNSRATPGQEMIVTIVQHEAEANYCVAEREVAGHDEMYVGRLIERRTVECVRRMETGT